MSPLFAEIVPKVAWASRKLASDQSKVAWASRKLASDQPRVAWASRNEVPTRLFSPG